MQSCLLAGHGPHLTLDRCFDVLNLSLLTLHERNLFKVSEEFNSIFCLEGGSLMVEETFVRCLQRAILGAQQDKLTVEASDLGNGLIFANNRCPGDKAMPSKDLF